MYQIQTTGTNMAYSFFTFFTFILFMVLHNWGGEKKKNQNLL